MIRMDSVSGSCYFGDDFLNVETRDVQIDEDEIKGCFDQDRSLYRRQDFLVI